MILFDEMFVVSAEQLSAVDIMLRYIRKYQIPIGGVLFLGTMDHAQLPPVDGLPFLLSTLVLTSFSMIQLKCSVRAHNDPAFQRFQYLTRLNPFELRNEVDLKEDFFELAGSIFIFVSNWDNNQIQPNMARVFSRKMPAKDATAKYVESLSSRFSVDRTPFITRPSVNVQRAVNSRSEYSPATANTIKSLNVTLKEPENLVFQWGV